MKSLNIFAVAALVTAAASPLAPAQATKGEKLVRNLRFVVAGVTPLPVFEQRDDQVIEVNPDLSKIPPTQFAFVVKDDVPKKKKQKEVHNAFSAALGNLTRINNYKGTESLKIELQYALSEKGDRKEITCPLDRHLEPLIIFKPKKGNTGWRSPEVEIIDYNQRSYPKGSALVINTSPHPIIFAVPKGAISVAPGTHKSIDLTHFIKDSYFKYKVAVGKSPQKMYVFANSAHSMSANQRFLILTTTGVTDRGEPSLMIIPESL